MKKFLVSCIVCLLPVSLIAAEPIKTIADAQSAIESGVGIEAIPRKIWKKMLTPEQYKIMWRKGTERAFTGDLLSNKKTGTYLSAGCKIPVFRSDHKFKSGTGWPSFWEVFDKDNIIIKNDWSFGLPRKEILSRCGEHLGHVFEDGPAPTGLRYCINSTALVFEEDRPHSKSSE